MKLEFIDWKIRLVSSDAMQYDNKAWKLELVGDLPEGWSWEAMIANGENMDIIPLDADGTGASALLTAENLSLWGDYAVQIRGKNGDVVRHSNKIHVYIPNSLSGDAKWPKLPTAFSQAEKRITAAAEHPPVPGDNGCWMIWDVSAGAYRQSDVPVTVAPVDRTADMTQPVGRDQDGRLWTAPGGGGSGTSGVTPTIGDNGNWYLGDTDTGKPSRGETGPQGPAGADGKSAYAYAVDGGYTGTEAEFAAKLADEMPDKLPNPNALTFTGAVTGSYDGSEPVNVEIPSGGGSGGSADTSTIQETVLASGAVSSGTAKWHKTDTGLTASDLKKWKIWGFRCVGTTGSNGILIGTANIQFSGEKCQAILGWADSERKAIQIIDAVENRGYEGIGISFFRNGLAIGSNSIGCYAYFKNIENETDAVYIYTHIELTDDLQWEIRGLIK